MRYRLPAVLIALALAACSSGTADTTTSQPTATTTATATTSLDWRQAVLDEAAAGFGTQGALALVLDGNQRWAGAYGVADSAGTPVTVDMRFRAGSITKPVVATIAVLLSEDGQLDLDAPVQSIIPGLVGEPAMTTRQLLQHTAGFFDLGNEGDAVAALQAIPDPTIAAEAVALLEQWQAGAAVVLPDETLVRATDTQSRYFQPGAGYHYSNPGYQLVGMILRQASSGLSLGDLLQLWVTEPNDLATMTLAPWDSSSPALRGSGPDLDEAGVAIDNTDDLFTFGNGGNGGLLTTADDLARFFRLLLKGEIVAPESLEEMITASEPSIRRAAAYGLGLGLYGLSCGVFYGHGGAVNGTESIALADADGERVVVAVFNSRIAGRDPGLLALAETLVCGSQ